MNRINIFPFDADDLSKDQFEDIDEYHLNHPILYKFICIQIYKYIAKIGFTVQPFINYSLVR